MQNPPASKENIKHLRTVAESIVNDNRTNLDEQMKASKPHNVAKLWAYMKSVMRETTGASYRAIEKHMIAAYQQTSTRLSGKQS